MWGHVIYLDQWNLSKSGVLLPGRAFNLWVIIFFHLSNDRSTSGWIFPRLGSLSSCDEQGLVTMIERVWVRSNFSVVSWEVFDLLLQHNLAHPKYYEPYPSILAPVRCLFPCQQLHQPVWIFGPCQVVLPIQWLSEGCVRPQANASAQSIFSSHLLYSDSSLLQPALNVKLNYAQV